jgi:hypothetical protein
MCEDSLIVYDFMQQFKIGSDSAMFYENYYLN